MQDQLRISAEKPGRIHAQCQVGGNALLAVMVDQRRGILIDPGAFHFALRIAATARVSFNSSPRSGAPTSRYDADGRRPRSRPNAPARPTRELPVPAREGSALARYLLQPASPEEVRQALASTRGRVRARSIGAAAVSARDARPAAHESPADRRRRRRLEPSLPVPSQLPPTTPPVERH